jgi:hypothetical protein
MTDEQRLQMITEQLLIVRDNLFRGLSKSMQKLQAQSINEVLELPNYTESPQRTWVGLTDEEVKQLCLAVGTERIEVRLIEAKLKEKNGL